MKILKHLLGAGLLAASLLWSATSAIAQTPTGCIAWWKAEGNQLDSIGSHHGAATNPPSYGPGRVGQAFSFNGTNQLMITNVADLSFGSGGFSFALWVKKQSTTQDCTFISKYNTSHIPYSREYTFGANPSGSYGLSRFQNGDGYTSLDNRNTITSESLPNDTNWHHLAVTFDPAAGLDGVTIYFDGQARASTNLVTGSYTTMQASSEPVRIGNNLASNGNNFTRALYDEIMIFNRPLSAAEILTIYDTGATEFIECQDLNNNQLPAGWTIDTVNGRNYSFDSGRLNAVQVDGGVWIGRPIPLTNVVTRIKTEWTAYLTPIYWGMHSTCGINFDHGGGCSVRSELKTVYWGSDHAAYFSPNGLNVPLSRVPGETGAFRHTLVVEKGRAALEVRRITDGSLFNSCATNDASLDPGLATSVNVDFDILTTTGSSTWIDDLCIEMQYATNIAPTITTNPVTQTAGLGGPATFCVTATGSPPPNYQWYLNGSAIGGANGACFSVPNTSTNWLGSYQVQVWNSAGTNWSATAGLWLDTLKMYAGVNVYGPAGSNCVVQYATNLAAPVTWIPLKSVTIVTNPTVIIDYDSPGQPKRFYRTVPQ